MPRDLSAVAEHVNNLFNVDKPDLVDVPGLSREEVHALNKSLEDYSKNPLNSTKYFTGISVEVKGGEDAYTLSVRRVSNA